MDAVAEWAESGSEGDKMDVSELEISNDVVVAFNKIKSGALRFAMFKMAYDYRSVVLDRTGGRESSYNSFVRELPDEPRFAVFDYEYVQGDKKATSELVFICYIPDTARVKSKVIYASSRDTLKKSLTGVPVEIVATDFSELDEDVVLEKLLRKI